MTFKVPSNPNYCIILYPQVPSTARYFTFRHLRCGRMPDLYLRLGDQQYKSSSANHGRAACSPLSAGFACTMTKKRQAGELLNSPLENSWPEPMVGTANPEADAAARSLCTHQPPGSGSPGYWPFLQT